MRRVPTLKEMITGGMKPYETRMKILEVRKLPDGRHYVIAESLNLLPVVKTKIFLGVDAVNISEDCVGMVAIVRYHSLFNNLMVMPMISYLID